VGAWSDLYALGCTLWEWTTGAPPFSGPPTLVMHRQLHSDAPPYRPRFDVPAGLEATLRQLMAKRPGDRPASVGALRRAFGRGHGDVHERLSSIPSNSSSLRSPGLGLDLVALRTPHVVGRHAERTLLTAALQEVVDTRRPAVRLLQGDPGVGRRHLLRWLAESAAEAGLVEVVWNPVDLAEVRARAAHGPVVVAFEVLDARIEELLASVAFCALPVLALAPCEQRSAWEELLLVPRVEVIDVDPLPDAAIRQLLHVELGVTEALALRMTPSCGGLPGTARAWLQGLAAEGELVATQNGFEGPVRLGAPPSGPVPVDLDHLVATTDAATLAALQAAACWGPRVSAASWQRLASALGADPDRADLAEWMRLELVRRPRTGALHFRSERARAHLQATCTPEQLLAMADAAGSLGDAPNVRWVRGMLMLDGGRPDLARPLLLQPDEIADLAHEEHNQRAIERLRPHMADATIEERVRFQLMDMRTTLNLASSTAAVPLADRLRRTLQNLPRGAVAPELALQALEIVALVYVFEEQTLKATQVLDTLPETPRVLRARGLSLEALGRAEEAIACLEKAYTLETHPQRRARILNGLGGAHGRLGHHTLSIDCFTEAAATIDPQLRHVPLGNLATALLLDGRPREAFRAAQDAYASVVHHGARRVAVSCITYAIAAALSDRPELDAVQRQALYSLQRWGMSDIDLQLDLLRAARPTRPEGQAFLDAVLRTVEDRA
jgi:tetratricopeptide (TPR) repeat protein